MIKQIFMGKRRVGQTMAEFKRYYLEHHAPLIMKTIPHVRRYTLNFAIERPGKDNDFDFVTEVWWDDIASARAFYKSDAYQQVIRTDELDFGVTGQAGYFEEFIQK